MSENGNVRVGGGILNLLFQIFCTMCSWTLNHSVILCILTFLFWPFVLIKWLLCQDLTLSVIKATFAWFFN